MNNGTKTMEKQEKVLFLLGLLFVLVIGGILFYIVSNQMKEKNYTQAIEQAEKYLLEQRYEDAVIAYQNAIEINEEEEEAYIGLANAYTATGNYSKAKAALNLGYGKTQSIRLRVTLLDVERQENLQYTLAVNKSTLMEEEVQNDVSSASQNIRLDQSFVQKILTYTFDDFKNEFGSYEVTKNADGYYEVRHEKLGATFYYRNTDDNANIVDESLKLPKNQAMPEKMTLDSLSVLFRDFDGIVGKERLELAFAQTLQLKTEGSMTYIQIQMEDMIFKAETDKNGNIVAAEAWNEIVFSNANKNTEESGVVSGVVIDAVSGDGVSGATLHFTPSGDKGEEVEITTDSVGVFKVEVKPGDYLLEIKAEDYISEEFECTIEEGKKYSGLQFSISSDLISGTARIVLEWDAQPQDLDSNLIGYLDNGAEIGVDFTNKSAVVNGDVVAELDLDDTDGYGPETTTIHDLNGVYVFTVTDFQMTSTMETYGATVKVYLPGQSPVVITLSPNVGAENVWYVFELDHGTLNIVNRGE